MKVTVKIITEVPGLLRVPGELIEVDSNVAKEWILQGYAQKRGRGRPKKADLVMQYEEAALVAPQAEPVQQPQAVGPVASQPENGQGVLPPIPLPEGECDPPAQAF